MRKACDFNRPILSSRFLCRYIGGKWRDPRAMPAGVSVAEALSGHERAPAPPPPRRLLGYVEAHIEQGPVLEEADLALGVVTSIAGQTRARVILEENPATREPRPWRCGSMRWPERRRG